MTIASFCYRCLQTASFAAEGLGIPPQDWTVTCAVGEVCSSFGAYISIAACIAVVSAVELIQL